MRLIQLTFVMLSCCSYAQNTNDFLKDYFNPSLLSSFDSTIFYSHTTVLNPEFGIHRSKVASLFKISNKPFHLAYQQYGYKHFKESKYSLSSANKLSTKTTLGLNINLHSLVITEHDILTALSFDLGLNYQEENYEIRLFLENPLNNNYIENDLESRFIAAALYYWAPSLFSDIQLEESIHSGFNIRHQLNYAYKDYLSLSILQSIRPFEYGMRLGYKKDRLQFYTQYQKLSWTNSTGFSLIYLIHHE